VIRQTFFNGKYALVGADGLPNPDYWVSAIYKKLVSNLVLKVNLDGQFPATFNIYGHCSREVNRAC
jgi:heparanase 1